MVFGGPEVSYDSADFLRENEFADIIMRGEGERTYKNLLEAWTCGCEYYNVDGISYRKDGVISENPNVEPLCLDDIKVYA